MTKVPVVVCLGFCLMLSHGARAQSTQEPIPVGPIKTIRFETASVRREGKWVEGPRVLSEFWTYDRMQRLSESVHYDGNGLLLCRWVGSYDARGNVVEELYYRPEGSLDSQWVRHYDANGNLTAAKGYDHQGGAEEKTVFHYDRLANVTTAVTYNREGLPQHSEFYSYDQAGSQTGLISTQGDGSFSVMYRLLDWTGQREDHWAFYDPNGSLDHTSIHIIDSNGVLTREATYDADASLQEQWDYRYNEAGYLLEMAFYRLGGPNKRSVFVYEIDSADNWTKKTEWVWVSNSDDPRFEPSKVTYRTITYS